MSDSMSIRPRPGLATRAKNANQRPGRILISSRRARRSSAHVASSRTVDGAVVAPGKAFIAGHLARNLKKNHVSTILKPMVSIEQQGTDSVAQVDQGPLLAPAEARKDANIHPAPICTNPEIESGTTPSPPVYDIVSIARMILAGLVDSKQETSMDCIEDTQLQSYALHSYYSPQNSRLHLLYQARTMPEDAIYTFLGRPSNVCRRGAPRPTTTYLVTATQASKPQ